MGCSGCGKATVQRIEQAVKAIKDNVRASPELYKERLAVCRRCEHLKQRTPSIMSQCRVCWCFVEGKAWLKNEHCPKDKW